MIFIDSNIPMYLVGRPHPHKTDAERLLDRCIRSGERLVTNAEVMQEILHRYDALDRRDAVGPAFAVLQGVVDEVLPITAQDALRAKDIVLAAHRLSARDALHLAVMERNHIRHILSFDKGFDEFPGVERLS